jgi:rhamnosyltransferase subunit A
MFHIDQIFSLDQSQYVESFRSIDIPVLFVNGSLDEYTTIHDVRMLARYIENSDFAVVPDAGHFLDLESTGARRATGAITRRFLFADHCLSASAQTESGAGLQMAM